MVSIFLPIISILRVREIYSSADVATEARKASRQAVSSDDNSAFGEVGFIQTPSL